MNILITGGTGYIGEHFVPKLLECGYKVRLLVRNLKKAQRLFGNTCEYFIGDITDRHSLSGCCDNIDIVFHMVAKVGNQLPSDENFKEFRLVNVEGTRNLIEESKKANIKRLVFVSSIAAMGIVNELPISEKSKCMPYLPYQVSKYEAEQLIVEEINKCNYPAIIVRPTKVYGVGEHEYSYLTLAKLCKRGIYLQVGKKNNYTSNIYVTDLVQALVKLVKKGKNGETYILTSDGSIGFNETGKIIAEVLNKRIVIFPIPARLMICLATIEETVFNFFRIKPIVTKRNIEATISDRVYDISKAKNDIGYSPEVSLQDGIRMTVKWYIDQGLL